MPVIKGLVMKKRTLKISTKLPDEERFVIHNLVITGMAIEPNEKSEVPPPATHKLVVEHGTIVGIERVRFNSGDRSL